MPDHDAIYREQAEDYERMIARQPSLADTLRGICPFAGRDCLDLGAGTGRLSAFLAAEARTLVATDSSAAMLRVLESKLAAQAGAGARNWRTLVADHRRLPLPDESFDLVVSGWSVCYLANAGEPGWRSRLDAVLAEMLRLLRPGGAAVIMETMGTGTETPDPPATLVPYYRALEEAHGFRHSWMRLDYAFDSQQEAEGAARFFFGDELAARVRERGWTRLPECAGIWRKRKA